MKQAPVPGQRSDIPPMRPRTPSPVRVLTRTKDTLEELPRDFDINPQLVDVIYAEDEEIFRETAVRELVKVGFDRNNIHEAENGLGALEHLARMQLHGHLMMPILVILDVRMPGMDGRECALQIQELVKKKVLRREPFVICISSIHRQVIVDEGKGNFQVVIPKPFNTDHCKEAFNHLKEWWTMGYGRQLPAWKNFSPTEIDVVAADSEPVCRMSAIAAFTQAGVCADSCKECEDEDEMLAALREAQQGDHTRPLILLLGMEKWVAKVRKFTDDMKDNPARREPFVVCTSVDSARIGASNAVENFHVFLPGHFGQPDVKWCLEFCRLWWLTRGDGPEQEDRPDSQDSASEMSEMSADSEESHGDESDEEAGTKQQSEASTATAP